MLSPTKKHLDRDHVARLAAHIYPRLSMVDGINLVLAVPEAIKYIRLTAPLDPTADYFHQIVHGICGCPARTAHPFRSVPLIHPIPQVLPDSLRLLEVSVDNLSDLQRLPSGLPLVLTVKSGIVALYSEGRRLPDNRNVAYTFRFDAGLPEQIDGTVIKVSLAAEETMWDLDPVDLNLLPHLEELDCPGVHVIGIAPATLKRACVSNDIDWGTAQIDSLMLDCIQQVIQVPAVDRLAICSTMTDLLPLGSMITASLPKHYRGTVTAHEPSRPVRNIPLF